MICKIILQANLPEHLSNRPILSILMHYLYRDIHLLDVWFVSVEFVGLWPTLWDFSPGRLVVVSVMDGHTDGQTIELHNKIVWYIYLEYISV